MRFYFIYTFEKNLPTTKFYSTKIKIGVINSVAPPVIEITTAEEKIHILFYDFIFLLSRFYRIIVIIKTKSHASF